MLLLRLVISYRILKRYLIVGATLICVCYLSLLTARCKQQSDVTQMKVGPDKIILFWTEFFESKDFEFGIGRAPFVDCATKTTTCLATSDRDLFNDSDAVIFHAYELDPADLPPPGWRRSHQHYVFLMYESPANTDLDLLRHTQFRDYFNRTMTYRLDSDVVDLHPYGRIKCIDSAAAASDNCRHFPNDINPSVDDVTKVVVEMDLSRKNKTVAWFVSNCHSDSRRELLARNLNVHIPVDVYGPCNNSNLLSCPRNRKNDCDRMLSRHYRFYLSFENSLCPDYVTEKVYRPMMHDTVPVVYGGSDYRHFLPAGSYVNAMDFDSPLELANYLKKLMDDDELYKSYFRWRKKYTVQQSPLDGMCRLCQLLGDASVQQKTYYDMAEWWIGRSNNKTCFSPTASLIIS